MAEAGNTSRSWALQCGIANSGREGISAAFGRVSDILLPSLATVTFPLAEARGELIRQGCAMKTHSLQALTRFGSLLVTQRGNPLGPNGGRRPER
jgi:hypothetical protein